MNRCDEMKTRIQEHIDRNSSPDQEILLAKHLLYCSACREELSDMERAFALFDSMPIVQPSTDFEANIMAAIGRWHVTQESPRQYWWNRIQWLQGFASICLLIYLIVDGMDLSSSAIFKIVVRVFQTPATMVESLISIGQNWVGARNITNMFDQLLGNLTLFNAAALFLISAVLFGMNRILTRT